MKEIARGLCPPLLWNFASRVRRQIKNDAPKREIVHGVEMILPPSHLLPSYVRANPHYDTLLPEFLQFLRVERSTKLLVVDVGANVGDTALLVAAKLGADNVQFISLEADDQYIPLLKTNTAGLDIEIICAIVGAVSKEEHLRLIPTGTGTSVITAGADAKAVVSLDDVLVNRRPDVIKTDTDGYDIQVLRGASRCLRDVGPHVFVEYSPRHIRKYGREEPTSLFASMSKMEYCTTIVYDFAGYPICLVDLNSRELAMIAQYIDAKRGFYADLLISKDRELLTRFYEADRERFAQGSR